MWRFTQDKPSAIALTEIPLKLHWPGKGPNFLKLLAKSPASLLACVRAAEALSNGKLTSGQREEIALAVAEINGSNYCLAAHEATGRQAGLTDAEISLARKASAENPKTKAMLHFVQALVLQRGEVSDEDFTAIQKAGFSESEMIEILANVVLNIFANYFNLLAQTDLDGSRPERDKALEGKP
jgi:uncharacterized peroxidase-related enzyme